MSAEFAFICTTLLDRGDIDGAGSVQRARMMRNACAGITDNAAFALNHGVLSWLRQYCQDVALSASRLSVDGNNNSNDSLDSATTRKQFVAAILQFLSNYAACGPRFARSLWSSDDTPSPLFGEVGFRNALAAAVTAGSRPAAAAVVSAMFNSFKQVEEEEEAWMGEALDSLCSSLVVLC